MPKFLSILLVAFMLVGCKTRPDNVLDQDSMAEVIADLHVGEAIVDNDHMKFRSDSMKKVLKQSILDAHGVTPEQFDTSLVWYAHNIDKYIKMYDQTIKILEDRNVGIGNMMTASAMSMSGDSVDIWGGSRYLNISDKLPSQMVAFDVAADENTLPGDVYVWRIKLIDVDDPSVHWSLVANYDDNTVEQFYTTTAFRDWNETTFMTDSTKTLTRMRGYFTVSSPREGVPLWVDSVSLVRKRVTPEFYLQRSHRQIVNKEY